MTSHDVLWAMTAMASYGVAAFFTRFWWQTRDRLFLLFGLATFLLAVHWTVLAALDVRQEARHLVYLIRLVAFLLILAAIIDKNRASRPSEA